jgi:hypothetical protein
MSLPAFFVLMLQACPDPTTASDLGHGPGGGPAGGPAGGGSAGPGQPLGPPPEAGSFQVEDGSGVTISGTLVYEGSKRVCSESTSCRRRARLLPPWPT